MKNVPERAPTHLSKTNHLDDCALAHILRSITRRMKDVIILKISDKGKDPQDGYERKARLRQKANSKI